MRSSRCHGYYSLTEHHGHSLSAPSVPHADEAMQELRKKGLAAASKKVRRLGSRDMNAGDLHERIAADIHDLLRTLRRQNGTRRRASSAWPPATPAPSSWRLGLFAIFDFEMRENDVNTRAATGSLL